MHTGQHNPQGTGTLDCCVWSRGGLGLSLLLFASDQPQAKEALARIATPISCPPVLTSHSPLLALEAPDLYPRPVNQNKTDLRI